MRNLRVISVSGVVAAASLACGWLIYPALGASPTLHEIAASAIARRDWARADASLRAIIEQSPDDADAASALRALYNEPGVDIPIDEEALARTLNELGAGFRVSKSRHYVVVSDCSVEWTASRTALLERTFDEYGRTMDRLGLQWTPPRRRMLCVLIRDHTRYSEFAARHDGVSAQWIGGYYSGASNRVVFYDDITGPAFERAFEELAEYDTMARDTREQARASRRDAQAGVMNERADRILAFTRGERERLAQEAMRTSTAKTIHEATHLIAYNCGLQDRSRLYPFWFSEGLASSFETEDAGAAFGPDHRCVPREQEWESMVRQGRSVPMDLLVTLTDVPGDDRALAEAMYAQSYAMFSYLFRYKRAELAAYARAIAAEPSGRIPPVRLLELFEAHFGSTAALHRRLMRL